MKTYFDLANDQARIDELHKELAKGGSPTKFRNAVLGLPDAEPDIGEATSQPVTNKTN
eukprot:CAMPEP_0114599126 /NCGR_PEP_ID=MMETSP0125-20121206/21587_1 /TAXON_ID=485358 ORGANISM="Aristerostoma sp., Strain ATCC 50986" /NCGR_SAMPLE_ID=MMETSP0125 /ASSEMBLY_ACC=CAM_ASM_000245 /LENGTH=57 /DNA_ID=CAMNT_0001805727 /DNA_START=351 /DNA_END=524 /DNA_ORIENTATION=+